MRKLVVMLFISLLVFACQKEKSVSVNVTVKDKNIDEGVYFGLMKMDTMSKGKPPWFCPWMNRNMVL